METIKKIVFTILITFISLTVQKSFSQIKEVKGVVKDSQTGEVIPFANIYLVLNNKTENFGTMCNEFGEYEINNISDNDEIIFSHLSYFQSKIKIKELEKKNVILLDPKIFKIDEVVISKVSTKDYLKGCIDISLKALDNNIVLNSYVRELTKLNGDYQNISDAMIDYYITKSNGKSKIVLNESRAFIKDSSKLKRNLAAYDIKTFVKNSYDFSILKKIIKNKNYQFEIQNEKKHEESNIDFIKIIPNKNVEKFLFEGYVIINKENKTIKEFKIYTSDLHRKYATDVDLIVFKMKIDYILEWSSFKTINNQYILDFNSDKINISFKTKDKGDFVYESSYFIFIQDFKNDVLIPKVTYEKESIFEAGTKYSTKFWDKSKASPFTTDEQLYLNSFLKNNLKF